MRLIIPPLRRAERLAGWPSVIPRPRPRRGSAKAAGLAFERALRDALPGVESVWFRYEDGRGPGLCQVDGLLVGAKEALVLEAKLSWVEEAQAKLIGLYLPVVEAALAKRALGVVVVRRLTPEAPRCARSRLDLALADARLGRAPTGLLHWLGPGHPLVGTSEARRAA